MSTKSEQSLKEYCTEQKEWAEQAKAKDENQKAWLRAWAAAHKQILEEFTQ